MKVSKQLHRRNSRFHRQIILGLLGIGIALVRRASSQEEDIFKDTPPDESKNCSQAAIEDFPGDFFNQNQRVRGGFLVHTAIALYFIFALAIVCDDYFVPVLEDICQSLNISSDVAGATFMAAGTSSPEFFTNVIGTFVTESDLGIGTIIGTAVFNIFGVIAACGLFAGKNVPLEWYPITRDCLVYCLSIVILIIVLIDSQVFWYESLVMLAASVAYTVLMYYNVSIEKWSMTMHEKLFNKTLPDAGPTLIAYRGSTKRHFDRQMSSNGFVTISKIVETAQTTAPRGIEEGRNEVEVDSNNNEERARPWNRPKTEGIIAQLCWALYFPVNILLFLTVPKMKVLYPLCFFMCMAWIGVITYIVAWMITLIGYTFGIPDSVMGLSFLAIGTSVPEVFSSLIVSRQGKGSMAISNSIGSNTFDILVCLGLPWTIKSIMNGRSNGNWFVQVDSAGLAYTVISLLASLVILYLILIWGKFLITKLTGVICLLVYSVFLTISILFELNVFFQVNLPMCETDI